MGGLVFRETVGCFLRGSIVIAPFLEFGAVVPGYKQMSWHPMQSNPSRGEPRQVAVQKDAMPRSASPTPIGVSSRLRSFIIWLALKPLLPVLDMVLAQRRRFYQRLTAYCMGGCFVECWSIIGKGKPVDSDSPEFEEIFAAINHYLPVASRNRGEYNALERIILRTRYSEWAIRDTIDLDVKRVYRFVLKHRLAPIFKRYINLYNYVGYISVKEIAAFERSSSATPSIDYWSKTVKFDQLPPLLDADTKAWKVKSYLRKNVVRLKRELAENNYTRFNPSFSDLSAFIALSGSLLLLLGYLRVSLLGIYFRFPFQDYFSATDYLRTSVNLTGLYLFSAALTAAFVFLHFSTLGAYSLQEPDLRRRSIPGRIDLFGYHALGMSACVAFGVIYLRAGMIEPLPLFAALMYAGSIGIPRLAVLFFEKPVKAYVALWLIYSTVMSTITGVMREVDRLNSPPPRNESRTLQFEDRKFDEMEWQFIAFTSEYILIRNRSTHSLTIRARSGLKSIDNENMVAP